MGMSPTSGSTASLPWHALFGSLRKYAVFTLDAHGIIDSWNQGVLDLLGYEEAEFVGQRADLVFTPEDREEGRAQLEMSLARQHGEAADDRWHLRQDGSRLWVNGIMHAVRNESGEVTGYLKIMRDQTLKRALNERIAASQERFSKAFRENPTPIVILSGPECRVVDVNDAFKDIFEMDQAGAQGLTLPEFGFEPDEGSFEDVYRELSAGNGIRIEAYFPRVNGEQGYATLAFEPIELGGTPHALMLMHDVTEWYTSHAELEQQHELVSALLDSLPGVFFLGDGKRLLQWNAEMERVTGRTPEELAGVPVGGLTAETHKSAIQEFVDKVLLTGEAGLESVMRHRDGTHIPFLITGRRIEQAGKPLVLGVGVDISEQVHARRVLQRRAREQTAVAELNAVALSAEEIQSVLDYAAERAAEVLDGEHVQIVERTPTSSILHVAFHKADVAVPEGLAAGSHFDSALYGLLDDEAGHWPVEDLLPLGLQSGLRARIRGRGRTFGFIEVLSSQPDAFSDEDLRFLQSFAAQVAGAVEQVRLHRELAYRADHDDLTGLLTRVSFEHRLMEALARAERVGTKVAALFLDLDRFKNVNDSLGHQAGDDVLRAVARRLRDTVRSWDVIARHGGDEFVMFMPDIESITEVAHVTERLVAAFAQPFEIGGRELRIGTTVGVAVYPEDGRDVETLLRAADTALYEGKGRGRNNFHFFTRRQNERVMKRLELETELRRAVTNDEFRMVYQPQVDLRTGSIAVVEGLLRWRHPERGVLAPREFLAEADSIGLAVPLGEWALEQVFADHARWKSLPGAPARIAVNVSPLHLLQPSFPETFCAMVEAAGLTAAEIELEFTEATLLKDPELVTDHLRSLHQHGITLVVDDFGTSASPLARLRSLPIGRLKIDETFTHQLGSARGRSLVQAIVQVALGLGVDPVAEGIETATQHREVLALGFRAAQGRHFSAPLTREELRALSEGPSGNTRSGAPLDDPPKQASALDEGT